MPRREAEAGLTSHDRAKEATEPQLLPEKQLLPINAMHDIERRQMLANKLAWSFAPNALVRGPELILCEGDSKVSEVRAAGWSLLRNTLTSRVAHCAATTAATSAQYNNTMHSPDACYLTRAMIC
jgi:hypothetical protein